MVQFVILICYRHYCLYLKCFQVIGNNRCGGFKYNFQRNNIKLESLIFAFVGDVSVIFPTSLSPSGENCYSAESVI